jgi:hypothetical protein
MGQKYILEGYFHFRVAYKSPIGYRWAIVCLAFLRPLFLLNNVSSSSESLPSPVASAKSFCPTVSASLNTLVLTVAPSRLFFPSRRDNAIFSMKSHNLPSAIMFPVAVWRSGVHSGASFIFGVAFNARLFTTRTIPSSSKRWYAFLRVSLLTASK